MTTTVVVVVVVVVLLEVCQLERGMSMKRKVDDAASGCANHYCNDDEKDLKDILIESLQKQLAEAR